MKLSNVIFAGVRPKKDMPRVVASADMCLAILQDIPMFRTTYPNKVFDTMAAGRATVLVIDGITRALISEEFEDRNARPARSVVEVVSGLADDLDELRDGIVEAACEHIQDGIKEDLL